MYGHARGGNDTMIGSPAQIAIGQGPPGFLYGDAFTMSGHTSGGDDTLLDTAAAAGDADSMSATPVAATTL